MGMFDEIVCEYPLPRPEFQHAVFQTKDLDNTLARNTITKDGRLRIETWQYVHRDDPTAFFGFVLDRQNWYEFIDQEYHGDLFFYTNNPATNTLITFRARFTEGQLTSIVEVSDGA
jgi:hypothetical protein